MVYAVWKSLYDERLGQAVLKVSAKAKGYELTIEPLRYIKHRRRSENWQAYKCYRGFIEQLAHARAADSSPKNSYKTLDSQNNDEILALFFTGNLHEKERK